MELLLLGAIAIAALHDFGSSKPKTSKKANAFNKPKKPSKPKKRKSRSSRRDDSWLHPAWFHDHNQNM